MQTVRQVLEAFDTGSWMAPCAVSLRPQVAQRRQVDIDIVVLLHEWRLTDLAQALSVCHLGLFP